MCDELLALAYHRIGLINVGAGPLGEYEDANSAYQAEPTKNTHHPATDGIFNIGFPVMIDYAAKNIWWRTLQLHSARWGLLFIWLTHNLVGTIVKFWIIFQERLR